MGLPDTDTAWLLELKIRSNNYSGPIKLVYVEKAISRCWFNYIAKKMRRILMYHWQTQIANDFYVLHDHNLPRIYCKMYLGNEFQ